MVGSDDAGYEYTNALKGDLASDKRVSETTDVGVGSDEDTAYVSHPRMADLLVIQSVGAESNPMTTGPGGNAATFASSADGVRKPTLDKRAGERGVVNQ